MSCAGYSIGRAENTDYEQNRYPASITDRMVSGYFYNHDADNAVLKPLLGHDVKNDSVSMDAGGRRNRFADGRCDPLVA